MEETEDPRRDLMQRLKSSTGTTSSSVTRGAYRCPLPTAFSPEAVKRPGIPPTHPSLYSIPSRSPSPQIFTTPHHSRSLSQPPSFLNLDSLLPFNSNPPSPRDATMDDRPPSLIRSSSGSGRTDGLPPLKAHRRSQSDIPFAFLQSGAPGFQARPLVKQESDSSEGAGERKSPPEDDPAGDDLFRAFMNLDGIEALNSEEERREDLDSRASGSKTNGGGGADSSENEAESSSVSGSSGALVVKEGNKRSAAGDPVPMGPRHCRSLSMDSFMGKVNFAEELLRMPPSPATPNRLIDGMPNGINLEFGHGEFSAAELKKVMANEKLAEIAMTDPRRVKRILANRQSAARSKERKTRYISELEHKVQTLQTEATTLSAQLTMFQRDYSGLHSQNIELKFRLQAMEQQAKLRDALNEALNGEVQRLKLAAAELGEAQLSNSLNQQIQLNRQMFQLQQLQKQQYQFQQQQQQQSNSVSENETNN